VSGVASRSQDAVLIDVLSIDGALRLDGEHPRGGLSSGGL
jgi:hypothetical protein